MPKLDIVERAVLKAIKRTESVSSSLEDALAEYRQARIKRQAHAKSKKTRRSALSERRTQAIDVAWKRLMKRAAQIRSPEVSLVKAIELARREQRERARRWAAAILRAAREARAEGREPTAQDLARAAEEVR